MIVEFERLLEIWNETFKDKVRSLRTTKGLCPHFERCSRSKAFEWVSPLKTHLRKPNISMLFLKYNNKYLNMAETPLERGIMSNPEWITGVEWGIPREGHPEGKVINHIKEVLANIEKRDYPKEKREKLRLIALLHDSFKCKVDEKKPHSGTNHHAFIARKFAEKHSNDSGILDVIELHDEAYNSYLVGKRRNDWKRAEERAQVLIKRLGGNIGLFIEFYVCDNETGNKDQESLIWFKKQLGGAF